MHHSTDAGYFLVQDWPKICTNKSVLYEISGNGLLKLSLLQKRQWKQRTYSATS